jgi:hypothetical protein
MADFKLFCDLNSHLCLGNTEMSKFCKEKSRVDSGEESNKAIISLVETLCQSSKFLTDNLFPAHCRNSFLFWNLSQKL